ncbi:DUF2723 domain-containing protein [Patescibacteria group bacterium]|nr:DUF2723 domain-containing protein [Patescibacteria group bacterium]
MKSKNLLKNIIVYLLVFLIPFGVYLYTLCPTISVYADAGEYPTMAAISGFAHPPGYPLFILILKAFLLLPFGSVAYKANLASAFLASCALVIFYLLLKSLTKDKMIAFVSVMILAFSKIFWRIAIVSEVFSLTALFMVLIFLLFQLWATTGKKKFFFWFLITSGFGLAHHQGVILVSLLPFLIWFLVGKMWRQLKIKDYHLALPLILVGYLPYFYIYLVAHRVPPMNWDAPQTLSGLFRLMTRASYGSFRLTLLNQETPFGEQMSELLKLFLNSFSAPALLLALIGLAGILRKNRRLFFHCLLIIGIVGIFLSWYSGMPLSQVYQIQYLERFQVITSIFLVILIAFGLVQIKKIITKVKKQSLVILTLIVFVLIPLFMVKNNFSKVSQRGNYFGEKLGQDILANTPQNSILIFGNDAVINALLYQRYALEQRRDVAFLVDSFFINDAFWWRKEISAHYPEIIFPEFQPKNIFQYFIDFVDLNSADGRQIVMIENSALSDLGIDLDDPVHFRLIGLNRVYLPFDEERVSFEEEEKEVLASFENYQNLKNNKTYIYDWPEASLINIYTFPLSHLAEINPKKAQDYYQKALEINPDYAYGWFKLGEIFQEQGQKEKAQEAWQKALATGHASKELTKMIKEKLLWEEF